MATRVFFSFHYQRDIWRVNQVRNSWVTKPDRQTAGFFDASLWEDAKKSGDSGVKRVINQGLEGTTRTAILTGTHTFARRWVRYEIAKSFERLNRMVGISIHQLKTNEGFGCEPGFNPLEFLAVRISSDGRSAAVYEWDGHKWIDFNDLPKVSFNNAIQNTFWNQWSKLSKWYPLYDWITDNGYKNFSSWVA